jgi:hypothetical protein
VRGYDRRGGARCPRSIDVHHDLQLPAGAIRSTGDGARAADRDGSGVRQVEETVHRHQAAPDVPRDDVHRVDTLGRAVRLPPMVSTATDWVHAC